MIAFENPRREQQFRLNSAKAPNFFSMERPCCKCGAKRPMRDLEIVTPGPYTRFNPKRHKCKGGCDVAH